MSSLERTGVPKDRFSTPESAFATGLSSRNVMYLCSLGVVPVAEGGEGRGRHRQLNPEGLATIAVVSAFFDAGVEIFLAAKLVEEISQETTIHRLANLESFLSRAHSGTIHKMSEVGLDPENTFHLHHALRTWSNSYTPHQAAADDHLLEIYDRTYVFLNYLFEDETTHRLQPNSAPIALFQVKNWKKGSNQIEFTHAPAQRLARQPRGWSQAFLNYRGMVRINASLAIREAFDTVAKR